MFCFVFSGSHYGISFLTKLLKLPPQTSSTKTRRTLWGGGTHSLGPSQGSGGCSAREDFRLISCQGVFRFTSSFLVRLPGQGVYLRQTSPKEGTLSRSLGLLHLEASLGRPQSLGHREAGLPEQAVPGLWSAGSGIQGTSCVDPLAFSTEAGK